jgi:predicted nucleic acid-binding protein
MKRYSEAETAADDEPVLSLAMERALTVYDACYLDLAQQLGTALLTEDKELIQKSRGVAGSMAAWLSRQS